MMDPSVDRTGLGVVVTPATARSRGRGGACASCAACPLAAVVVGLRLHGAAVSLSSQSPHRLCRSLRGRRRLSASLVPLSLLGLILLVHQLRPWPLCRRLVSVASSPLSSISSCILATVPLTSDQVCATRTIACLYVAHFPVLKQYGLHAQISYVHALNISDISELCPTC